MSIPDETLARWAGWPRPGTYGRIAEAPGYTVDAHGIVRSHQTNWRGYGERVLVQAPNSHGYMRVRLQIGGRRVSRCVHKLVADAFLPAKPAEDHQIRHLNGDRSDNRAINLAWGTAGDNAADRDRHGRTVRGERVATSRLTEEEVVEIRRLLSAGVYQHEIASRFGCGRSTVGRIKRRESWVHLVAAS